MTEEEAKLLVFLDKEGYHCLTEVPDQGICGVMKLGYTWGLFVDLDYTGYGNRYCFKYVDDAVVQLRKWDGVTALTGYVARR